MTTLYTIEFRDPATGNSWWVSQKRKATATSRIEMLIAGPENAAHLSLDDVRTWIEDSVPIRNGWKARVRVAGRWGAVA